MNRTNKARTDKGPIQDLWIVRNPGDQSILADILWKTRPIDLAEYVIGAGAALWRAEETTMYTNESEARLDAEQRLASR